MEYDFIEKSWTPWCCNYTCSFSPEEADRSTIFILECESCKKIGIKEIFHNCWHVPPPYREDKNKLISFLYLFLQCLCCWIILCFVSIGSYIFEVEKILLQFRLVEIEYLDSISLCNREFSEIVCESVCKTLCTRMSSDDELVHRNSM